MSFKVGDWIEFDYMSTVAEREIKSIGEDGTLYVNIEDGKEWAVYPGVARTPDSDPPEALNNFRMGPPESSSDSSEGNVDPPTDPPTEKLIDLDTYAKVATVIVFGGLILTSM